jgi:hypothetical protein
MKVLAILLCSLTLSSGVERVGSVRFTVLNRWGHFHRYKVLHFRMSAGSPDLASSFRGLVSAKVPYGFYNYELVPLPGDVSVEKISGTIRVVRDQNHVTNVLETTDSVGHRAQLPVSGMLEPRPKGREPVWVILQNVYGKYREESTVDDRGRFQLHHIWGNNVIVVCAGSEVLMSALVNIGPQDSVNYLSINLQTARVAAEFKAR